MAYGTVSATINIQESADHATIDHYIVAMEWAPIPDGQTVFTHTQLVTKTALAESLGDVDISRPNAPTVSGDMYVRVYAAQGSIVGVLSNEVVVPYDFRPGAPVISLV
jgi:hypothetical protein